MVATSKKVKQKKKVEALRDEVQTEEAKDPIGKPVHVYLRLTTV